MWKRDLFPLCLNSFLLSLVATQELFVLYICMYVLNMGSNNSLPQGKAYKENLFVSVPGCWIGNNQHRVYHHMPSLCEAILWLSY